MEELNNIRLQRFIRCLVGLFSLLCSHLTIARYANVIHEVKPVASGHRLVLIYNLIDTSPRTAVYSVDDLLKSDAELQRVLSNWNSKGIQGPDGDLDHLCYSLRHQYTSASLRMSSMKGLDKKKVRQVAKIAKATDFTVYLGTLEQSGNNDPDDDDEDECQVETVVDLEGNKVARFVNISEDILIPDSPFENRHPNKR